MSNEPKTIEIIPSWESIVPMLVHAAANGTTAAGRNAAMGELMRLARTVDQMNADVRKAQEQTSGEDDEPDFDGTQADAEGWGLFSVDGRYQLQRDDARGVFASDAQALIHVALKADAGSRYHRSAIEMIGTLTN